MGPYFSMALPASNKAEPLEARFAASSTLGPITSTSSINVITRAASADRDHIAVRRRRYSGQVAVQTTAANRIAGTTGCRTR